MNDDPAVMIVRTLCYVLGSVVTFMLVAWMIAIFSPSPSSEDDR